MNQYKLNAGQFGVVNGALNFAHDEFHREHGREANCSPITDIQEKLSGQLEEHLAAYGSGRIPANVVLPFDLEVAEVTTVVNSIHKFVERLDVEVGKGVLPAPLAAIGKAKASETLKVFATALN